LHSLILLANAFVHKLTYHLDIVQEFLIGGRTGSATLLIGFYNAQSYQHVDAR